MVVEGAFISSMPNEFESLRVEETYKFDATSVTCPLYYIQIYEAPLASCTMMYRFEE